ncbi:MAG: nucleoside hydrolase [Thermoguttaceae bacterium]|jgi:inosine-uridine nucleoside N-ribohydrolase
MRNLLSLLPAVLLTFSLQLAEPAAGRAAKIPVILDTDIGDDIDDTWALVVLLKSPELDLKLVTTTYGKAEYRAKIVAKMLTVAARTDVHVGLGEGGHDGTGGQQAWVQDYKLADYRGTIHADGAGALIELVEKSTTPITIISIGPLNTLAAALQRRPEIAARAAFAGMQGSVRRGYGSAKPEPEWNVKANVAAAQKVLSAPWRSIAITPLDTCGLVTLSGDRFEKLKGSKDPRVQAMLENYRIWARQERLEAMHSSSVLFDTVGVFLATPAAPSLLELEQLSIRVTPDGFTRIDPHGAKMSVATRWKDLDGYRDRLVRILMEP